MFNDRLGESIMLNTRLIKKLQNEHKYFSDMLKSIEKIKKKTPGNGFAKMKCKEKLAELDAIFERMTELKEDIKNICL